MSRRVAPDSRYSAVWPGGSSGRPGREAKTGGQESKGADRGRTREGGQVGRNGCQEPGENIADDPDQSHRKKQPGERSPGRTRPPRFSDSRSGARQHQQGQVRDIQRPRRRESAFTGGLLIREDMRHVRVRLSRKGEPGRPKCEDQGSERSDEVVQCFYHVSASGIVPAVAREPKWQSPTLWMVVTQHMQGAVNDRRANSSV